jgi:hypothetical protein
VQSRGLKSGWTCSTQKIRTTVPNGGLKRVGRFHPEEPNHVGSVRKDINVKTCLSPRLQERVHAIAGERQ